MNDLYEQVYEQLLDRSAHRYENYFACRCIFHNDNSPSLFVYHDRYYCKGCGATGTIQFLFRRLQGQPIRHGSATAQPKLTPHWYLDSIERYCIDAHEFLLSHPDYGYYLQKRGLCTDLTRKLQLGYADGYYIFPIMDRRRIIVGAIGRVGETKAKAGAPRYTQPHGQLKAGISLYIPSYSQVDASDKIYIPYGIIDCLTLYQLGYPTMAYTSGKVFSAEVFAEYRKQIILIPDQGEESAARRCWKNLGWRGTIIVPDWPEGCKDVNDVFTKRGELAVRSMIDEDRNHQAD